MIPARLLVVAWMACVFALGVWHRPIAPRPAASPPVLPVLPGRSAALAPPIEAIRSYLRVHYDDIEVRDSGAVIVTGLAYVDEAPLTEVHDDLLRRFMPGRRFFRTWLRTGTPEDRTADVIISFRRTPEGDDIRAFAIEEQDKRLRKFLGQFIGVVAPNLQARRDVALMMAILLNGDGGNGTANIVADPAVARVQLHRGEWHVCDVDVSTDHAGRVDQLVVRTPGDYAPDFCVH